MFYYNPDTKEEAELSALCAKYATSFPKDIAVIRSAWFLINETESPQPEDGYKFVQEGVELKEGKYYRAWERVPLTEEEIRAQAYTVASTMLNDIAIRKLAQSETLSADQFTVLTKAGLFDEWHAGVSYEKGTRVVCNGIVYEVLQSVTSLENQPPSAEGMLAIYSPLSVDPNTGVEPDGSKENPYEFIYGMSVANGSYYTYNGRLYLAKQDMPTCVWTPDTDGLWQWELIE